MVIYIVSHKETRFLDKLNGKFVFKIMKKGNTFLIIINKETLESYIIIKTILTSIWNKGGFIIELKTVSIQKINGSYFAYLPKIWVQNCGIEKGDKLTWSISEGNHEELILRGGGNENVNTQ